MRQRPVKMIAGIWTIKLTPIDVSDFGLSEGDLIDIEDLVIKKKEAKKK